MLVDMSRNTVEYLCKNVTSPNIARRFGHKLTEDEGPYVGYISQVGKSMRNEDIHIIISAGPYIQEQHTTSREVSK